MCHDIVVQKDKLNVISTRIVIKYMLTCYIAF